MDSEYGLGWCPEVVEVLDHERDVEVAHLCEHEYDHEGQHGCVCGLKWDMEVPC